MADNGPGVPAALAAHIFTPFFSTKKQGRGIGLAMVRQIVELHNGQVQAASGGSGHGASFTVWLPLDSRRQERETLAPSQGAAALEGVRILVVDDSEDVMEAFTQLLQFTGATVRPTRPRVTASAAWAARAASASARASSALRC